jgi:oxygen-dependent protoporphyrinogen oxidase
MTPPPSVVVVGGGISGLTTAFWLRRHGIEVTVLEQELHPGGTMRTLHEGEWLVETGPNSALETTPLFGEMFDALGIAGERRYADDASDTRYILRGGSLHPLPLSPPAFLKSRLWTVRGKLRLLKEPFIGRATKEETIAEFVERRLGREFLDYAINPFVAGVFAGNPEQLSVRSAFPKLYALEERYGGLIRGMIGGARERKKRAETAKDRARMFSFAQGMQTFPDAIASLLGASLRTECSVRGVRQSGKSFAVDTVTPAGPSSIEAGCVVLAVPSYAAAPLVAPFSSILGKMLERVYYPPVAEVFLGFPTSAFAHPLDGFGFLIPAVEHRLILGTIWSSSLFRGRAPAGHVALTSFVGGSRQPEVLDRTDDALRDLVVNEIRSILGGSGEPVFSRVLRWQRAIPQYNLGYQTLIDAIERLEHDVQGLYVCNNYRGGIAVGDCVMNGRATADRIRTQCERM